MHAKYYRLDDGSAVTPEYNEVCLNDKRKNVYMKILLRLGYYCGYCAYLLQKKAPDDVLTSENRM